MPVQFPLRQRGRVAGSKPGTSATIWTPDPQIQGSPCAAEAATTNGYRANCFKSRFILRCWRGAQTKSGDIVDCLVRELSGCATSWCDGSDVWNAASGGTSEGSGLVSAARARQGGGPSGKRHILRFHSVTTPPPYVHQLIHKSSSCLVPLAGIEPALLAESDFESDASTSSAIGARAKRTGPI
jgi:hypothetical protein